MSYKNEKRSQFAEKAKGFQLTSGLGDVAIFRVT